MNKMARKSTSRKIIRIVFYWEVGLPEGRNRIITSHPKRFIPPSPIVSYVDSNTTRIDMPTKNLIDQVNFAIGQRSRTIILGQIRVVVRI